MSSIKYRQRLVGGKWKSYPSPSDFLKDAEYYTDIIKNYDETPHLSVYHIGVSRGSADDRYFNHVTRRFKLVYVLEGSGWFNGIWNTENRSVHIDIFYGSFFDPRAAAEKALESFACSFYRMQPHVRQ